MFEMNTSDGGKVHLYEHNKLEVNKSSIPKGNIIIN